MYERPLTYRDWLDTRHNESEEDDELDVELEEDGMEDGPARDDGFPLHDRYDEESFP